MVGQTVGHYRVTRPLGHGGMGEVYLADDARLKRQVALKFLPSEVASDAARLERFEREAQVVAGLNHPNIVTVHSIERQADTLFIVMEYLDGRTLAEIVPRGGLPLTRLLSLATQIVDALVAAHGRGVVHRDLKPSNVMALAGDRVKVLDFGLAKLRDAPEASTLPTQDLTGEGRIVGTVAYMSPEQAEGKPVDERSDIFAVGVILYEMATGERPFKGDTSLSVLSSILRDTPRAVTELNPGMPRDVWRIVRALSGEGSRSPVSDGQGRAQRSRRSRPVAQFRRTAGGHRREADNAALAVAAAPDARGGARRSSRRRGVAASRLRVASDCIAADAVTQPPDASGGSGAPAEPFTRRQVGRLPGRRRYLSPECDRPDRDQSDQGFTGARADAGVFA